MAAVTYDKCTKLGCCHNQISSDIAYCHHKIPSMHTFNVSAGLFLVVFFYYRDGDRGQVSPARP